MSNKLLFRLAVLVTAMMCALDASAAKAYVFYTSSDSTLTFYYDNLMWSREGGLPGELNTGDNDPDWLYGNLQLGVAHVVFDPSFANARQRTMFSWFKDMTNLRTIEGWENLNTSLVTNMSGLFFGCSKLTSVDLSHLNTNVVTRMSGMFYGCNGLTSLDLSGFITFRVTDMYAMFGACSGLTSLDLSNFDTSSVTDMEEMFNGCSNLTTIYVGNDWSTASVKLSSYMFYNCTSLVGGMGTTYSASHVDKAYAHIDGGPSDPGYLTAASGTVAGDVNGDTTVNIADVTSLIDMMMNGGTPAASADVNGDGVVNISDVTALIDYMLTGTWN